MVTVTKADIKIILFMYKNDEEIVIYARNTQLEHFTKLMKSNE